MVTGHGTVRDEQQRTQQLALLLLQRPGQLPPLVFQLLQLFAGTGSTDSVVVIGNSSLAAQFTVF